jgi:hypothetical protein
MERSCKKVSDSLFSSFFYVFMCCSGVLFTLQLSSCYYSSGCKQTQDPRFNLANIGSLAIIQMEKNMLVSNLRKNVTHYVFLINLFLITS